MKGPSGNWPANVRSVLAAIVREVAIVHERLVQIAGEAPEMALSTVTLYPNEQVTDPLVAALTERLYTRYYCRRITGLHRAIASPDDDLLEALRAANTGWQGWERGWEVLGADERGELLLRSGARTRLAAPGNVRRDPEDALGDPAFTKGDLVWLCRRCEDITSQADYFYALGEAFGDRYEELVGARFYLGVRARSAAWWIHAVTHTLNRHRVPFAFKVLRHRRSYRRIDTGILYVPRNHASFVATVLLGLPDQAPAGHGLHPRTPLFTRRLAAGLALADNPPGGESFGIARMQLVAQAIVSAWRDGKTDASSRLQAIASRFRTHGLNPARPWLNPGNVDVPIERGIAARVLRTTADHTRRAQAEIGTISGASSPGWIDVADRLGARIVRDALWHDGACTWLGWGLIPGATNPRAALCTVGGDLYSGTAGIGLFLAQLARFTDDRHQRAAAAGAFRHSIDQLACGPWRIGAYAGIAGVLRAAIELAEVFDDERIHASVGSLIERLGMARPAAHELDIIEGRAGAIRVLLQAAATLDGPVAARARSIAVQLGHELLGYAHAQGDRLVWDTTTQPVNGPLLGYGHGTAGIGAALFDLFGATRDPRMLQGALGALRHEQAGFDVTARNWPDRRAGPNEEAFMTAWCSGAPGVALALASCAQTVAGWGPDPGNERLGTVSVESSITGPELAPLLQAPLALARQTTLRFLTETLDEPQHRDPLDRGSHHRRSFCLCHGIAGNADIALQLSRMEPIAPPAAGDPANEAIRQAVTQAAEAGMRAHHDAGDWPCGIRDAGQSPGLMLGLAGIGHFYLRLHDPSLRSALQAGPVLR